MGTGQCWTPGLEKLGAAEKTLQGQSLESVSAKGIRAMLIAEEEETTLFLWPGVRPPEIDPG